MEKLPFLIHGTSITDQATAHNVEAEHRLHLFSPFALIPLRQAPFVGVMGTVVAIAQTHMESHHGKAIENAFSKLKALLRKRAARSFDTNAQALGDIIGLFSITVCRNYFKAAGYEAE